jgi:hypothetical protein
LDLRRKAIHIDTIISINIEHPMDNATTQVLTTSLPPLIASAFDADNVRASGSGPRNEVSNSSGIIYTKELSLKAPDNTESMSEWTFEIGAPMELTSSFVFNIAQPCTCDVVLGSQLAEQIGSKNKYDLVSKFKCREQGRGNAPTKLTY